MPNQKDSLQTRLMQNVTSSQERKRGRKTWCVLAAFGIHASNLSQCELCQGLETASSSQTRLCEKTLRLKLQTPKWSMLFKLSCEAVARDYSHAGERRVALRSDAAVLGLQRSFTTVWAKNLDQQSLLKGACKDRTICLLISRNRVVANEYGWARQTEQSAY